MPKHCSGQALTETVLLIPIIVMIITMIFWFSRIVLTRQQLLMAARYGTDLIYYTKLDENRIRAEIRNSLCGDSVEGRKLDPRILGDDSIRIRIYRKDKADIRVFAPDEVNEHSSYVEISYAFDSPGLFSAWNDFIPGAELPEKLTVSARSEVLAGTGCKGE